MRLLLFIIFVLCGYALLLVWRQGLEEDLERLEAFLGGLLCVIMGIAVLFFERGKERDRFISLKKPSVRDYSWILLVSVITCTLLVSGLTFGAEKVEQARVYLGTKFSNNGEVGGQDGGDSVDGLGGDDAVEGSLRPSVVGMNESPVMRIPQRGELKFAKLAELWISPDDSLTRNMMRQKSFYVKVKSLNKFDGNFTWSASNPTFQNLHANELGFIPLVPEKEGNKYVYTVKHKSSLKHVYGITGLEKIALPRVKEATGSHYILPRNRKGTRLYSYLCVSNPVFYDELKNDRGYQFEIGDIDPVYSRNQFQNPLRNSLLKESVRLKQLGYDNPRKLLKAVKDIFLEGYEYSLDVENTKDVSPIENFLYHEKKGYCVHFATATALLLRELGIPCRISTGYSKGDYYVDEDTWVLYSDNAHAWVEIYTKKWGWVVFDTTPSAGFTGGAQVEGSKLAPFPTDDEVEKAYEDLDASVERSGDEELSWSVLFKDITDRLRLIFAILFVLFLFLVSFGIWKKIEKSRRGEEEIEDDERVNYEEKEYIGIYRRVAQLNALPMMYGDTLGNHVKWLSEMEQKPNFADELLEYHYDTTYRMRSSNKSIEKRLIKRIKNWKR